MRLSIRLGAGLAVVALIAAGCKPSAVEDPSIASWRFAGSTRLSQLAEAPGLKLVLNTNQSEAAGKALAARMAHTLWFTVTGNTNAPADAVAVATPLLQELLRVESAGAVFDSPATPEFGFCARLDAARVEPWRDGMVKFFSAARGGDIGVSVTQSNGVLTVAFPATAAARVAPLAAKLGNTPRTAVLEADLDFAKWTRSPWPTSLLRAPRARVTTVATNQNVRTTATLSFPEELKLEKDAWQLPTSVMGGLTRSLTAVRGIRPLVEKSEWFKALNLKSGSAPNQFAIWMQPLESLQTYFSVPVGEPEAWIAKLAATYRPVFSGTNPAVMGVLGASTNGRALYLDEIPIQPPPGMLALRTNNATFLAGGLFPSIPGTNRVPAQLLEQLNKPDLVAYSWEITEEGIKHWRTIAQLRSIMLHHNPVSDRAPGQLWLDEILPKLGNTVTEVHQTAPNELRIVRSGPAGLNGLELVTLTRWIDGPSVRQRQQRPGSIPRVGAPR